MPRSILLHLSLRSCSLFLNEASYDARTTTITITTITIIAITIIIVIIIAV